MPMPSILEQLMTRFGQQPGVPQAAPPLMAAAASQPPSLLGMLQRQQPQDAVATGWHAPMLLLPSGPAQLEGAAGPPSAAPQTTLEQPPTLAKIGALPLAGTVPDAPGGVVSAPPAADAVIRHGVDGGEKEDPLDRSIVSPEDALLYGSLTDLTNFLANPNYALQGLGVKWATQAEATRREVRTRKQQERMQQQQADLAQTQSDRQRFAQFTTPGGLVLQHDLDNPNAPMKVLYTPPKTRSQELVGGMVFDREVDPATGTTRLLEAGSDTPVTQEYLDRRAALEAQREQKKQEHLMALQAGYAAAADARRAQMQFEHDDRVFQRQLEMTQSQWLATQQLAEQKDIRARVGAVSAEDKDIEAQLAGLRRLRTLITGRETVRSPAGQLIERPTAGGALRTGAEFDPARASYALVPDAVAQTLPNGFREARVRAAINENPLARDFEVTANGLALSQINKYKLTPMSDSDRSLLLGLQPSLAADPEANLRQIDQGIEVLEGMRRKNADYRAFIQRGGEPALYADGMGAQLAQSGAAPVVGTQSGPPATPASQVMQSLREWRGATPFFISDPSWVAQTQGANAPKKGERVEVSGLNAPDGSQVIIGQMSFRVQSGALVRE